MASPVDTSVKNFNSTMVNAPVLNGVAGAAVAWLDALLDTGFDLKSLTSLVAAAGVMTATFNGTHSSQIDSVVLVAGVTGGPAGFAGANGEQKVVNRPTSTTATWATSLPDGTYTGTITMKMASLGWSTVFSAANRRVYRSNDVTGTRLYLRVEDSGTTTCRVRMYETMSDIDTGTNPAPTDTQQSGGGHWVKSNNANATAVTWAFAGDSRLFMHNVLAGTSSAQSIQTGAIRGFGDMTPFRPAGDPYLCILGYASGVADGTGDLAAGWATNCVVPRDFTGVGSPTYVQPYALTGGTNYSGFTTGLLGSFPNPIDGALYVSPKVIKQVTSGYPRGDMPGLYHLPQSGVYDTFKNLDRIPAIQNSAGKTLQFWSVAGGTSTPYVSASTSANTGGAAIDLTGPWR
ncbi:hypothetical protein QTI51_17325 [Variovorax sp. J22G73]|uniref:hypothetical protein n=1 Tax=unclassified Variovorax TaxID=663243 RepID=UPI00257875E4|nr:MULTISPECIES: hypothetical protein [unclassified Variovorax]MDM0007197.1 hypothetical protein [Variovorax sp. J22R203]MDM0099051.1 hypothetical protein [Variovorax sp. J22G73]